MDALNRVVVGFMLPPGLHPMVTSLQNEVKRRGADANFRNTPAAEMAVAVCTPGEVNVATLERIARATHDVASRTAPFELRVVGLAGDPNPTQPRSAVLTIEGDEPRLEAMGREILHLAGITPMQDSGYKPRVEIGRLRQLTEQGRTNLGRAIKMSPKQEPYPFPVTVVEVFVAHAGPTGPELRSFQRMPLAGNAGLVT